MADLEEIVLEDIELQPCIQQRYVGYLFFKWEYGEDSKQFTETLSPFHSTIKFIAKCSKEEINFLNVNVRLNKQAT